MRNTKWMVLCLFIGFLLAAGMMSTIPIYMDASLQRMLIKDMEQYQIDNNKYPGLYSVTNTQQATIDELVSKSDSRINAIGIASENTKTTLIDDCLYIVNGERNGAELSTRLKLIGMTDSLDHMKLIRGELPSKTPVDGVYEGLASDDALKTLGINVGRNARQLSQRDIR